MAEDAHPSTKIPHPSLAASDEPAWWREVRSVIDEACYRAAERARWEERRRIARHLLDKFTELRDEAAVELQAAIEGQGG